MHSIIGAEGFLRSSTVSVRSRLFTGYLTYEVLSYRELDQVRRGTCRRFAADAVKLNERRGLKQFYFVSLRPTNAVLMGRPGNRTLAPRELVTWQLQFFSVLYCCGIVAQQDLYRKLIHLFP